MSQRKWLSVRLQVLDEILSGSNSDFNPQIEHIRAYALQNADGSATSDKSDNVEPCDDIFDTQTSTSRGTRSDQRSKEVWLCQKQTNMSWVLKCSGMLLLLLLIWLNVGFT